MVRRNNSFRSFIIATLLLLTVLAVTAGVGPQNVLIIANGNSKDSLEIANAYRRAREIPYTQLLVLKTSMELEISYRIYLEEIETPVRAYLKEKQLSDTVTCIVLVHGMPLKVNLEAGRSVASLLATMNLPNRPANGYNRLPNPYFLAPDAFSHVTPDFKGMYLVTILDGYHSADAMNLIARSLAAENTDTDGRFIFHTSPQYTDLKKFTTRTEVLSAPPEDREKLMGYFSGGFYSGLTGPVIQSFRFLPGALVDMVQNFSAAPENFRPNDRPVLLPVNWFMQSGATGLHGVVGDAGADAFPCKAAPQQLLNKYTRGFSMAESFYNALPTLNWQNVILGDPLCSPYLRRPEITVEMDPGPVKGIVPIRVSATSPAPGATISRIDVYVDGQFMQTVYEPVKTQITLYIGEEMVVYAVPHGATLRTVLQGLKDAVTNDAILHEADGVEADFSLETGSLILRAKQPGIENNDIPINVSIKTEGTGTPSLMARIANGDGWLSGGGQQPTPATAVISLLGRRIKSGDQVTLQVLQETITCMVPDDPKFRLSDLPAVLAKSINEHPKLQNDDGVMAMAAPQGMPYLVLQARKAGEEGNAIPYQIAVKPAEGSLLRAYPETPSHLDFGNDGSVASQSIQFQLGETVAKGRYLLNTADLADGAHRLRVVAYDGTLAQGQGTKVIAFTTANLEIPPQVTLPERLMPVSGELSLPVTAAESVKRVNVYLDGQLLGTNDAVPFEVTNIPLASLGRGRHDLWAEGIDDAGHRYLTAPKLLEILTAPDIASVSPAYTGLKGGSTHRITGSGFQLGCTVSLAGVPARAVTFRNPNLVEVVSDTGQAAGQGLVKVSNPDGTSTTSRINFEYYNPVVTEIHITPSREVLAPGQQVKFTAACLDQHNAPIDATVFWDPTGGTITPDGLFTAGTKPGSYLLRASHPDCKGVWEAPVIIGPARISDGRLLHWLVLGPFPDPDYTALEKDQVDPVTVRPAHGQAVEPYSWISLFSDNDFVNLGARLTPHENVAAYAHVYIQSPAEIPCALVFGSDDGIRIWLNSELKYALRARRGADPNQSTLPITLKAGWNRLLIKVDQGTGGWGFYLRLQGIDGKPLPDLYYALDDPVPAN